MPGLEDMKPNDPFVKSGNDSLGGDSGLETLKPNDPFVKSGNDSLGGDLGLEKTPVPSTGTLNTTWNGDGLAGKNS